MLFGQQSADGGGACLWAAVAERLRPPVVSQVSELTRRRTASLTGKRQTEYGYDTIRAPLPAVVAVADSINTPRYPSLKGIMGAKKKPQETLAAADVGGARDAAARRSSRCSDAAAARRGAQDRGRRFRRGADRRVPRREEARLMAKTLVFLEHHEGSIAEGLARRAHEGGADRRRRRRRARRLATCAALAESAGAFGAATVWVADDARLAAPLPQPRVDVLAKLVRDEGFDTVLFAQSVLAADVAAGLAARLDAGLNWGLVDFDGETGKAPQLADTVYVDVGWSSAVKLAIFRAGAFDAEPRSAAPPRSRTRRSSSRTSRRRPRWSSRRTPSSRGRRSRTPT